MGRISGQKMGPNEYWVRKGQVMEEEYVTRWLVQLDEYRWILYADEEDIEEWDAILEIRLPKNMALMLDYTQHSYFQMQGYFEAQWAVMQKLLAEDEPEYAENPQDGDQTAFQRQFEAILRENGLNSLEEDTDE